MTMNNIGELEKRGALVRARIERYMKEIEPDGLRESCTLYMKGGKMLRPSLALITAGAVGADESLAVDFAAAIEILNVYTLIHDDIIDKDAMRRGGPTVHAKFDTATAILAGDMNHSLSVLIFLSASGLGDAMSVRIVELLEKTSRNICEGQFYDYAMEKGKMPCTLDNYLKMAEHKTAWLYAAAAQGGSIIANADKEKASRFFEFGRLLGIGFQIWDDVLGLTADEKELKKPVGSDVREGKMSFPIIHFLDNCDKLQKEKLLSVFGKEIPRNMNEFRQMFIDTGSIEYARKASERYAEGARLLIPKLTSNTYYAQLLSGLVDFSVQRAY